MTAVMNAALKREIEDAWKQAVSSFSTLKDEGKLGAELWNVLQVQSDPSGLLQMLKTSPYAQQPNTSRLLQLADGCVDAVMQFNSEIGMVMQGVANYTLGASCIIWGGLGLVFHISQSLFKTPEVIVEIIAKIFVMMPRVDVYFALSKDSKDIMDARPLLVEIYKFIVQFNVKCATWYGSRRARGLRLLREDPRASFRAIFDKMTDASEEMRKQTEAIGWKRQHAAQEDVINRLAQLELNHRQRLEELRDVLLHKYQEETRQQVAELELRKAEEAQAEKARLAAEAEGKAKARENRLAELGPYLRYAELRQTFWRILHQAPWCVISDCHLEEDAVVEQNSSDDASPWIFWKSGVYQTSYPVDDPTAEILLLIDWGANADPANPSLEWMIDTPDSLFYPGKHVGRLEIRNRLSSSTSSVVGARLRIYWESGIFSVLPDSNTGGLSSVGPLEETAAPFILTSALQSVAHVLTAGPFSKPLPKGLFGWHDMGWKLRNYFRPGMEDVCMRACAFFANAFTRDVEGLQDLSFVGLPGECREASKMAIGELASFFKIDATLAKNATSSPAWDLEIAYSEAESQAEWVMQDRVWAGRIAELAELKLILAACKKLKASSKFSAAVEEAKVSRRRLDGNTERGGEKSAKGAPKNDQRSELQLSYARYSGTGRHCLDVDGLPKDWTLLHRAVWKSDVNVVMSLATPATANVVDDMGWTPLHLACAHSESSAFTFRQVFPRELSQRSIANGRACFPRRVQGKEYAVAMCRILLAAGADVNAKAKPGEWLPLHNAASSGWLDLARLLLESGSLTFVSQGCSPFCLAERDLDHYPSNNEQMRELLTSLISEEQMRKEDAKHQQTA